MIRIGLIGKTNTGKTTFFNAATLQSAEVSTYPFTTKRPNVGTANVQTLCVCQELKVKDNPRNSQCISGWRFVPVELIDLPGLIKGAWVGKGLGNQFLSVAAQAHALLHIVDASGSVDAEGRIARPGTGDPLADILDIEEELAMWLFKIIEKNKQRITREMGAGKLPLEAAMDRVLSGIGIRENHVAAALQALKLAEKTFESWSDDELKEFSYELRERSKPTIVLANKMDLNHAEENYVRLTEELKGSFVIPCCSEAELVLRRAEQKGLVQYVPGEEKFSVLAESRLTDRQRWALKYVQQKVLSKWIRTGVQFSLNVAIFKLLKMNSVYPVEDVQTLADKSGNVLPDVLLVPYNYTAYDLANEIHTELAKTMIYAQDARSGLRLPKEYVLKDRDVIRIVAAGERR